MFATALRQSHLGSILERRSVLPIVLVGAGGTDSVGERQDLDELLQVLQSVARDGQSMNTGPIIASDSPVYLY
jgi:hypothetical protein